MSAALCFDRPRARVLLSEASPILERLRRADGLASIARAADVALTTRQPYFRRVTNAQWIGTYGPRELKRCAGDIADLARIVGDLAHEPEPEKPSSKRPDNVIDLMEALKRSLARQKGRGSV